MQSPAIRTIPQGIPPRSSRAELDSITARLTSNRPHQQHPAADANPAAWASYYTNALGFKLCALPPGKKGPSYPNWQKAGLAPAHWAAHPEQGMGVILGLSRLVSLDIDDMPATRQVFTGLGLDLDEMLQEAMLIQGSPDRMRAIFRAPEGLDLARKALAWPGQGEGGKPFTVFELRGGPVQDCLPPSIHPGTGEPYKWLRAPWELERLGTLPPALLALWQDWSRRKPALEAACPWATPAEPEPRRIEHSEPGRASVIDAFNKAHDPGSLLEAHGYRPKGPGRWIAPQSSSGLAGVVLLSESGRIFTHHAADPLATGHAHDCFSIFTELDHQGDHRTAIREAAKLMGIEYRDPDSRAPFEAAAEQPLSWPDPQPRTSQVESLPYPLEALPGLLREAVAEAQDFTQAPLALVAVSALTALSLAGQGLADVRRAPRLQGPTSLFLLALADSGERKSTLDNLFMQPLRDWETEQADANRATLRDYQAELAAWEASRAGLKERAKGQARGGKSTRETALELRQLEDMKPEPPLIPRLLYLDSTSEALAANLAQGWPTAGLVSAEAGAVIGGHSMGRDSLTKTLALLNQLWDGSSVTIDRRTTDSFTLRGARLTAALLIQEPVLKDFLEKSGHLARGSGFLARFLLAVPESTQGSRLYKDPPEAWPALEAYQARLRHLLSLALPLDDAGRLVPPVLELDPAAQQAWREFHDALEADLAPGRELHQIRDSAAKAADNAARLAGLFHVLEHGPQGRIGAEHFNQAARVVAWHLNEAARFFGELALPQELADAGRLEAWLIGHCTREGLTCCSTKDAQRLGPIRERERLNQALAVLDELDRAQLVRDGRRRLIYLNPQLLEGQA